MNYIGSYPQQNNFYNYGTAYNYAVPIGGYGYNNTGYYNGYPTYDPLEIRRIQEEEFKRQQEIRKGEINAIKKMIEINAHFYGYEPDKESLDKVFSNERFADIQRDAINREQMYNLQQSFNMQVEAKRKQEEEFKNKKYNTETKDMSLLEFFETQGRDDYIRALENKMYHQNRQIVGQLYNHPGYDELLRIHNANKFFNPNVTIDDMEISLPEHLRNNVSIRKQQFLDAIMKGVVY